VTKKQKHEKNECIILKSAATFLGKKIKKSAPTMMPKSQYQR